MSYDFKTFVFGTGAHRTREQGMCVMEAVAYVAGEAHTDRPQCACPVIAAFMRRWNDSICDNDLRRELVGQFVFRLPGTRATRDIEIQRAWMAVDWAVRECAPEFLVLTPELQIHANTLRALPAIGPRNAKSALGLISKARYAAYAHRQKIWAAYPAAVAAAAEAAAEAAEAAAAAAVAAALAAALAAAVAAAAEAAAEAAVEAAVEAVEAVEAARRSLKPAVSAANHSAARLVDRMIRLTEPQEQCMVSRGLAAIVT
jgi:hypothetical protein